MCSGGCKTRDGTIVTEHVGSAGAYFLWLLPLVKSCRQEPETSSATTCVNVPLTSPMGIIHSFIHLLTADDKKEDRKTELFSHYCLKYIIIYRKPQDRLGSW